MASADADGSDGDGHFLLQLDGDGLYFRIEDEDSRSTIRGGEVESDEWSLVTVSWGEDGMRMYLNGEEVASDPSFTSGLDGNENPWTFGASQKFSDDNVVNNLEEFFDGRMDDIAIFDEQLSDDDIAALYDDGVQTFIDNAIEGGDITYPVDIDASLGDAAETLTYSIDLPDGGVLSAGTDNGDGTWSLTEDDLEGLTVTVPDDVGEPAFSVTAISTDEDGNTATATFDVGSNNIDAGDGNDTAYGNAGADTISGGDGNDEIHGDFDGNYTDGDDGDIIHGDAGDDTVFGGGGDDSLYGGSGDDVLVGGIEGDEDGSLDDSRAGDDYLDGGSGDDTMHGGGGDDTIIGGAGDDYATGGTGDDLFIFGAGDGADYFDGGNGWSDTVQLDDVSGGPGGDSGWTLQVDEGTSYTETDGGIVFDGDAAGTIQLSDGSELTFDNVDKIEW